jgi:hypothetical protein
MAAGIMLTVHAELTEQGHLGRSKARYMSVLAG